MIIDPGLLAPRHAFVLAIMTGKGFLVCHSLNQLLFVCHHVQAFYSFLLRLPCCSSSGAHQRSGD